MRNTKNQAHFENFNDSWHSCAKALTVFIQFTAIAEISSAFLSLIASLCPLWMLLEMYTVLYSVHCNGNHSNKLEQVLQIEQQPVQGQHSSAFYHQSLNHRRKTAYRGGDGREKYRNNEVEQIQQAHALSRFLRLPSLASPPPFLLSFPILMSTTAFYRGMVPARCITGRTHAGERGQDGWGVTAVLAERLRVLREACWFRVRAKEHHHAQGNRRGTRSLHDEKMWDLALNDTLKLQGRLKTWAQLSLSLDKEHRKLLSSLKLVDGHSKEGSFYADLDKFSLASSTISVEQHCCHLPTQSRDNWDKNLKWESLIV